jgi:hypothetical protein
MAEKMCSHTSRILFFLLIVFGTVYGEDYAQLARKIFNSHSKLIEKKYHLIAYGSGGGLAYDLNTLAIDYVLKKELTIPEARRLLVEIAESFMVKMNACKSLRPYMHEYPFSIRSLELGISFDMHREKNNYGELIWVSNANDTIYYYTKDSSGKLKKIFREDYKDSLKIVEMEKAQTVSHEN